MKQEEIEQAIERYNKRLSEFGETEKALGWGNKGRSKLRYHVLCSEFSLNGSTILDFGCGFGDMFAYIKEQITSDFRYVGVDINPNIIEIAKKKYGDFADFYVLPFGVEEFMNENNLKVDYILSSGIFNFKITDNLQYIQSTLNIFDKFSIKGFASNFLSDKVSFMDESNYHSNPGQILEMHYNYSNNIILRNNYMPFEFTVVVNKFDNIQPDLNVYSSFRKYV